MKTLRSILPALAFGLAAAGLTAGCETSFEVYGESDAYFSVFGVLDASADTQWVRVEALQDSLLVGTRPLDAVVTLTHPASGRQAVLRDSVFAYIGGGTAHNFWTTEPILPLESYRLDVVRSDGAASAAATTLPDTFPDPVFNAYPFSLINLPVSGNVCARTLEMSIRMERIAALEFTYRLPTQRGTERIYRVSYVRTAERVGEDAFEIIVRWVDDLKRLAALDRDIGIDELLRLDAVELLVASAGPNWPENALDDETVALPGVVTHVENGFGFLGGVVSRRLDLPIGDYRDVSCFE